MSKIVKNNKENTTGTFYRTYSSGIIEENNFSSILRQLDANASTIDDLTIEAESLFQKLAGKITLDESQIGKNYEYLSELNKDIEQHHLNGINDKEIDLIIKNQKESIKELYNQDRNQLAQINGKYKQQVKSITEAVEFKEKQIGFQRDQRDDGWSQLIDTFQKEIVDLERQFKVLRNRQDQVFQQSSLDMYHLEQQFQDKIEKEAVSRKIQHQTIIRIVSECIENIKYIY